MMIPLGRRTDESMIHNIDRENETISLRDTEVIIVYSAMLVSKDHFQYW